MRILLLLLLTGLCTSMRAQCLLGIDSIYCTNGDIDTIIPVDTGGYFDGDGISADGILYPELLEPGAHVITYSNTQYYDVDTTGTYAPITGDEQFVSLIDDGFSDGIEIGFDFMYFGSLKNFVRIHSNGFITFNFDLAFFPPYAIDIPTPGMPTDLIAVSWGDYDPTAGGTISWFTSGTAPNRKLAINYTNLPPYGEIDGFLTAQVILYETSNNIEIHTTASPDYGKRKTQGIENIDGTAGFVRPGRNNTFWETYNDYVAFIPQFCSDTINVATPPVVEILEDSVTICMPYAGLIHMSGAETFTWLSDDICTVTAGPDPNSFYLHGLTEGTYTCTMQGTDATGCSDDDAVVVTIRNCPTEIVTSEMTMPIIFPNPANEVLTISTPGVGSDMEISCVDQFGRIILTTVMQGEEVNISTKEIPAGVYYLIFRDGDRRVANKLIISH